MTEVEQITNKHDVMSMKVVNDIINDITQEMEESKRTIERILKKHAVAEKRVARKDKRIGMLKRLMSALDEGKVSKEEYHEKVRKILNDLKSEGWKV